MLKEKSRLWWEDITGPSRLVREVAVSLQNAESLLLVLSEHTAWPKQMRSCVENYLSDSRHELLVDFLDGQTGQLISVSSCDEVAEFLLDRYAYPEVKSGYRRSARISWQEYLLANKVLTGRVVWLYNMKPEQADIWLEFTSAYSTKTSYDGLFVVELINTPELDLPKNGYRTIFHQHFITFYDALLFNYLLISNRGLPLVWSQYIATVSALLCETDVELAAAFLESDNFTQAAPTDILLDILKGATFAGKINSPRLQSDLVAGKFAKSVWQAQLQTIFPLIETERVSFIQHYEEQIKDGLSEKYYDFSSWSEQPLMQYGDRLTDPYKAEIGTIFRMCRLKKASDQISFLLFLPNENDRKRLSLLYELRNLIAHGDLCPTVKLSQFLDSYPYVWSGYNT